MISIFFSNLSGKKAPQNCSAFSQSFLMAAMVSTAVMAFPMVMAAALVTLAMVAFPMVVAGRIRIIGKLTLQERIHLLIRISGSPREQADTCL